MLRIIGGCFLILIISVLFVYISPYFSLEYFETQREIYLQTYEDNPLPVLIAFICIVVVCTGAALPTTGVFALLGGALFGFPVGLLVVTLSCTLGAIIAFLWSRYFFRDWVEKAFKKQYLAVNRGVDEGGGYYLFGIRLAIVFPFFLVNVLCGLTSLRISTYIISTFLSQTIVFSVWTYAGSKLILWDTSDNILSIETLGILVLLGLAPLLCHRLFLHLKKTTV